MNIIKLEKNNQSSIISEAAKILKAGGTIVYPTETAYGLGADFFNIRAVKQVYRIKGRDYKKPLSVIVGSFSMAKKLAKFNKISLYLAKKHWPGPLTLVLEKTIHKIQVSDKSQISNSKTQTIALRISSNKFATALVKKMGRPITATSANVSGKAEIFSAREIVKQFQKRKYRPDLIIDAGILKKRKTTTIIRCTGNKIKVLRQGEIVVPYEA